MKLKLSVEEVEIILIEHIKKKYNIQKIKSSEWTEGMNPYSFEVEK